MNHLAQRPRHFGNAHRHNGIARFRCRQLVADGTNPADPGCNSGHFVERATLRELLEAPHLGDLKRRISHLAFLVKLTRNLRVAFDTADWFNGDASHSSLLRSRSVRLSSCVSPGPRSLRSVHTAYRCHPE